MVFDRFGSDERRAKKLKAKARAPTDAAAKETLEELLELTIHDDVTVREHAAAGVYNAVEDALSLGFSDTDGTSVDLDSIDRVVNFVAPLLFDSSSRARESAVTTLEMAARLSPESLEQNADHLLRFVEETSDESLSDSASSAVLRLLDARRTAVSPEMLESNDEVIRESAAGAYASIAERNPEAVEPAVPELLSRLDDSEIVGRSATAALVHVGRSNPERLWEAANANDLPVPWAELPAELRELLQERPVEEGAGDSGE